MSRRFPDHAHFRRARYGDTLLLESVPFSIANAAVRRAVWKSIRFNEHLPIAADREWARQVLLASYTVAYVAGATVEQTARASLSGAFRAAVLSGWTAEYLGPQVGALYPEDKGFVRSAIWDLLRRRRPDQLAYLAAEDAVQRYGYRLGRQLHRLAPSIRGSIAPEVAGEEPRRELRELERAA